MLQRNPLKSQQHVELIINSYPLCSCNQQSNNFPENVPHFIYVISFLKLDYRHLPVGNVQNGSILFTSHQKCERIYKEIATCRQRVGFLVALALLLLLARFVVLKIQHRKYK